MQTNVMCSCRITFLTQQYLNTIVIELLHLDMSFIQKHGLKLSISVFRMKRFHDILAEYFIKT